MKRTLRINSNINPDVKVGDRVKLINDETLTHVVFDGNFDLLRKYPSLGIDKPLGDITGRVTQTGITNFVVERDGKFVTYTQDIIVNVDSQMFRTSSAAVKVIKTPIEIIDGRLGRLRVFKTRSTKVQRDIANAIDLLEVLKEDINNHKE